MAQQCVLFQHKDLEYSTHLNYHCDILLELRSLNPPCLYRKQKFDIHNLCVLIVSYDSLQYSNQYNTNYLPVVLESSTIICVRMSITVTMIRKSNWPSFPIFLHPSLPPSLLFLVQMPQLWNRIHPTQSEVWAPAPSHRVCTNMHGAHFHRCHQRTSIWITRQSAIFEFRQNGINTRWRAQTTTAQQHESPKQLGPGKGFIILYINVLINKDSKLNSLSLFLSHTHILLFYLSLPLTQKLWHHWNYWQTWGTLWKRILSAKITLRLIKYMPLLTMTYSWAIMNSCLQLKKTQSF